MGFVESVSVAQSLALKRQQRIEPNRELLGLGAANLASAVSGGFPVTGGFCRSVVNFAAGANRRWRVISAALMALVVAFFTGWFHALPQAVLAATIIVAVTGLIDMDAARGWHYDKADALSLLATRVGRDGAGCGGGHPAGGGVVAGHPGGGAVPPTHGRGGPGAGTEHFRSVDRHQVVTEPGLVAVRVDESLIFRQRQCARPYRGAGARQPPRHVLLVCSAVNQIDATALGVLGDLSAARAEARHSLFAGRGQGPAMMKLQDTDFGRRMQGQVFLSTQ